MGCGPCMRRPDSAVADPWVMRAVAIVWPCERSCRHADATATWLPRRRKARTTLQCASEMPHSLKWQRQRRGWLRWAFALVCKEPNTFPRGQSIHIASSSGTAITSNEQLHAQQCILRTGTACSVAHLYQLAPNSVGYDHRYSTPIPRTAPHRTVHEWVKGEENGPTAAPLPCPPCANTKACLAHACPHALY